MTLFGDSLVSRPKSQLFSAASILLLSLSRPGVKEYPSFAMQAARSVCGAARVYAVFRHLSARAAAANVAAVRPKMSVQETAEALRRANAVCFDVDSTVITTEGIDELGAFLGKADEVW
jgi:hypothetical protein